MFPDCGKMILLVVMKILRPYLLTIDNAVLSQIKDVSLLQALSHLQFPGSHAQLRRRWRWASVSPARMVKVFVKWLWRSMRGKAWTISTAEANCPPGGKCVITRKRRRKRRCDPRRLRKIRASVQLATASGDGFIRLRNSPPSPRVSTHKQIALYLHSYFYFSWRIDGFNTRCGF